MPKLTKRIVEDFQFPRDKVDRKGEPVKVAFLWDGGKGGIMGFGARFTREGKCTYIVQGRVNAFQRRITIGPHGVFTVEQAREAAKEHLRSMHLGIDSRPKTQRDDNANVTLRQVADAYIARPGKLKESSKEPYDRHPATTFKDVEHKPIASITESYCLKRYREVLTGGLHGDREGGSPGQANNAVAILRALMNYANRNYKRADGSRLFSVLPTEVLKDHLVTLKERDTYVPANKIGAVWNHLCDLRDVTYVPPTLSAIELTMFMFLTGSRLDEPRLLTWDRVHIEDDEKNCWWHLDDPKSRRPLWLPLSTQAVTLLKERPRIKSNPHVFPGKNAGEPVSDGAVGNVWDGISGIAGEPLSSHDARRSFTNYGLMELNLDLFRIELLTSHKPKSVTTKHYLETKRLQYMYPEVQKIADWIEMKANVARAQADGSNVVPLRA